ncbi:TOBE domain-containing protein [Heyndrickxia coagulans]|uniref:TOBE domain-containing protein n=1 Tax=Heyndrickxia coagulans TaxID=1398 RepID=UPI0021F15405|nr:TOBE domain-containing protein [Heyndrickxia coagulans]UYM80872.1 TOBE domain-containing protein [Heyndrickxia coagulans]
MLKRKNVSGFRTVRPFSQDSLFPNQHALLGIRPEHFKPNAKSGDAAIQATVKSAEQLGDKTIIWFAFGNTQWKAKWAGQWQLDPDDRITVYFSPEDVHFFDPDTREKAFNMEKGGVSV